MHEALEGSLRRLGVERIDLYYVHRLDRSIPVEDTVGELAKFVDKRASSAGIGLSGGHARHAAPRPRWVPPIAAVQSEYSLWTRNPELGLVQACAETGALLVAFSPASDAASSAAFCRMLRPSARRTSGMRTRVSRAPRGVETARLDAYLELAETRGVEPATLAIAGTLAKGADVVPIPGTRTGAHLEECAAGAEIDLTEAEIAEIERALPPGFAAGEPIPTSNGSNRKY